MSLQIETSRARVAARDASTAVELLSSVRERVTAAAAMAAFSSEHVPFLTLVGEVDREVSTIGTVLGLTADRAEVADSGFGAMLDGWIASSTDALRRSINDGDGASVRSLLVGRSFVTQPALLLALTPEAAGALFQALPATERMQLVATQESAFDGTPLAGVIERWKQGLASPELRELFGTRALDRAGIDIGLWNPALGLAPNASAIEAVYEYYADLYRDDPDRLWWAGMAAMIGPSFYGGFQDLSTFATILEGAGDLAGGPLGTVLPGGFGSGLLAELTADELADELEWYQQRMLIMQQEIFFDMATAHEAYLDGGIETIERLYTIDQYGYRTETIEAWRQIDEGWQTGDRSLIATGNATLLRREQEFVIADDYDRMRDRPVTGEVMTYVMTAVGAPSVPGARTYPEVFPATVEISQYVGTPKKIPEPPGLGWLPDVPLPHVGAEGTVFIETPLPDGNISVFDDRWALIEQDTLPVWVDLAANHPDRVLDELSTPVGDRAQEYTIGSRWDDLIEDALTNWGAGIEFELQAGW